MDQDMMTGMKIGEELGFRFWSWLYSYILSKDSSFL